MSRINEQQNIYKENFSSKYGLLDAWTTSVLHRVFFVLSGTKDTYKHDTHELIHRILPSLSPQALPVCLCFLLSTLLQCALQNFARSLLTDYSCIVTLYSKVQQVLEYPKTASQKSILPEATYHLHQPVVLHISHQNVKRLKSYSYFPAQDHVQCTGSCTSTQL